MTRLTALAAGALMLSTSALAQPQSDPHMASIMAHRQLVLQRQQALTAERAARARRDAVRIPQIMAHRQIVQQRLAALNAERAARAARTVPHS